MAFTWFLLDLKIVWIFSPTSIHQNLSIKELLIIYQNKVQLWSNTQGINIMV